MGMNKHYIIFPQEYNAICRVISTSNQSQYSQPEG